MNRPSFDQTFLDIAAVLSRRATCPRRQVGVIVADGRHRIVAAGYNGSPRGMAHCLEVGCQVVDNHCTRAVHAEINAVLNAPEPLHLQDGTMYLIGGTPCYRCAQAIISSGIRQLVIREFGEGIYDYVAWEYLNEAGVRTQIVDG